MYVILTQVIVLKLSFTAIAQQSVKIKVISKDLIPVPFAIVKLSLPSTQIIAYGSTDVKGIYVIPTESPDSLTISVSRLGYKSYEDRLDKTYLRAQKEISIILYESETLLNEVIIRKVIPFQVNKDSTTFVASNFRDGSERSVEDLLKKLPGVQVSSNGTVSFNGKVVDKITIESDDFFSTNYKLITKNMSEYVIDKVDAIENYNDNRLLQGITRSDKTILNLRLRSDVKGLPFGDFKLGTSNNSQYELTNSFFLINSKFKIGQFSNFNDVGNNPGSEVEGLVNNPASTDLSKILINPVRFGINEIINTPRIPQQRFVSNKARMGAVNVSKTLSKFKFRSWVYAYKDQLSQSYSNNFSLLKTVQEVNNSENVFYSRNPTQLKSNLELDYLITDSCEVKIRSSFGFNCNSNSFYASSSINSGKSSSFYNQNGNAYTHSVDLTNRLTKNQAFQVSLYFSNKNYLDNYLANSYLYSYIPLSITDTINGFRQYTNLEESVKIFRVKYLTHYKSLLLSFAANYSSIDNNLSSKLRIISNGIEYLTNDSLSRNSIYNNKTYAFETTFTWFSKKWTLASGVSNQLVSVSNFSPILLNGEHYQLNRIPLTNLYGEVKYKIKDGISTNLLLTSIGVPPNITEISQGIYMSNYRTFSESIGSFNMRRDHIALFNFVISNPYVFLTSNTQVLYSVTNKPYTNFNSLQNGISYLQLKPVSYPSETYQIATNFDKYFHFIRTRINLSGSFAHASSYLGFNENQLFQNKIDKSEFKLIMSSAFKFPFNVDFGLTNSKINMATLSSYQISNKFYDLSFYGNLRISASNNKFQGNFKVEQNNYYINDIKSSALFADLWVLYKPTSGKFSYEIVGRNLFKAPSVYTLSILNNLVNRSIFHLVKPLLEIRLEYRLGVK
ncbi:carboxypeptidase-like regulatory domain-containing protein [Fibrella forsythiae]|uniref:Carboxypeptidase regulatory-like domain-containing protein n=1 Tax=Fibrella forsythiae TaxID=2817061 RepID=A0ABS3JTC0_9BACT|nr:carboxypeptidase-like regulatory domain-containing protein [Fibrella forsythiae]MBO0952636.1 carboxypeptidase regulatory-like domain-containing protein [Fibrella forsythiae]